MELPRFRSVGNERERIAGRELEPVPQVDVQRVGEHGGRSKVKTAVTVGAGDANGPNAPGQARAVPKIKLAAFHVHGPRVDNGKIIKGRVARGICFLNQPIIAEGREGAAGLRITLHAQNRVAEIVKRAGKGNVPAGPIDGPLVGDRAVKDGLVEIQDRVRADGQRPADGSFGQGKSAGDGVGAGQSDQAKGQVGDRATLKTRPQINGPASQLQPGRNIGRQIEAGSRQFIDR